MAQIDAAPPPSLSFTGKTAIVTTLIAIALNPISIIIGYYLSQSLQAPKLEINYVEPEYVLEPLRPSPALLQAWNKYPFFRDYIYQDLVYVGPSCRGWISDSVVRSSCINEIVGIAKQIRDRNKFSKEVAQNEINRI